ncbi:eukaryotic peptide chain release factor subunit 1 [Plasmodium yoelii yoelii]|uniref:Eukaryotic peptide chain release factor subunit 1 n=1 Tax=Plasmodium yoelii yoelii TaxID=73239 RepID=A0AAE9WTI7_PLAYO|nr:eukaryotic peptide chain release factor subunit 1 [Plasmodium yoelii yoelii]
MWGWGNYSFNNYTSKNYCHHIFNIENFSFSFDKIPKFNIVQIDTITKCFSTISKNKTKITRKFMSFFEVANDQTC